MITDKQEEVGSHVEKKQQICCCRFIELFVVVCLEACRKE